eukprot:4417273-Prymnesium_polylepis.1
MRRDNKRMRAAHARGRRGMRVLLCAAMRTRASAHRASVRVHCNERESCGATDRSHVCTLLGRGDGARCWCRPRTQRALEGHGGAGGVV